MIPEGIEPLSESSKLKKILSHYLNIQHGIVKVNLKDRVWKSVSKFLNLKFFGTNLTHFYPVVLKDFIPMHVNHQRILSILNIYPSSSIWEFILYLGDFDNILKIYLLFFLL
jgi:hypothetical protein